MIYGTSKFDIIFWAAVAACIVVVLIPAFIWDSMGYTGLWVLTLLVPFIAVGWYAYRKSSREKVLKELREQWGKVQDRKRDYKIIEKLFNHISGECKEKFYIDDQTWEDLNMSQVFAYLDRTLTTPGEQVLYNAVRTPLFEEESLKKRGEIIKLFEKDAGIREEVQIKLRNLGRQREGSTESLLWEDVPQKSRFTFLFNLMALLTLASIVSIPFLGVAVVILVVMPVFGINAFINYKSKKKILIELTSARYLAALINSAGKIGSLDNAGIGSYTAELHSLYADCSKILRKIGKLVPLQNNDVVGAAYEYFNILFLIEVRSFYSAVSEIKKRIEQLKRMYLLIGELDFMVSAASFRAGLSGYVEPELSSSGAGIEMQDGRHPLLLNPVPNSIEISNEGIIITGCNMSGKSTFLRTLGVNALFAQTIYTCIASSYKGSFLKVITSISRGDNLVGGKSYYLAEAEALLRIIKASGNGVPCLCIIDEMFRGTNSIERINASVEILKYLVNHNAIVIIATHDYELTEMVDGLYRCYYFCENIEKEGISFDYKIKQGTSRMRNAVRLMDYLGYPKEIINSINSRVREL